MLPRCASENEHRPYHVRGIVSSYQSRTATEMPGGCAARSCHLYALLGRMMPLVRSGGDWHCSRHLPLLLVSYVAPTRVLSRADWNG